jgi:hypothetical protein
MMLFCESWRSPTRRWSRDQAPFAARVDRLFTVIADAILVDGAPFRTVCP